MSTIFPKWTNGLPTMLAGGAVTTLGLAVAGVWYYATPAFWEVGYMPQQPGGGFNHQIHVGKLGMDCKYCHSNVEQSAEANIPTVSTCNGCHSAGKLAKYNDSELHRQKTEFIRAAYATDAPIEWQRVHKLPDYVRNFPHHAHIHAGVSCISCHGNIGRQPEVWQHESLSMSWCLDCHRNPEQALVEKGEVTRLFEVEQQMADPGAMKTRGTKFYEDRKIAAPENCGACHY
jgi:hypothetical protein